MNELKQYRLIIEYFTWEPMQKAADRELDDVIAKIRTKELLGHCGNVKTRIEEVS